MPIIELQRRMVEAGRIRAGERGAKGEPRKLDKWRLTSKDRQRLEQASSLWGGEVREWAEQWELHTEVDSLPIMLTPETQASLWYELYSAAGCQRRCDGVTEHLSDEPCLCDPDNRECKPTLRFAVLLPDVAGIGHWLVVSHGFNAACEIPGAINMLSSFVEQGIALPARLRLEQRKDVANGQTRKYAVPVIDIDVPLRELLGGQAALPSPSVAALPAGYTPVTPPTGNGVSLGQGLAQAEAGLASSRSAPIPETDASFDGSTAVPVDDEAPGPPPGAGGSAESGASSSRAMNPTKKQLEKLNVLVGQLRDNGHITTEHLWSALANARNVDVDVMIPLLKGRDDEGELHWSPLRDDLNRGEASDLIDRLTKLEEHVAA